MSTPKVSVAGRRSLRWSALGVVAFALVSVLWFGKDTVSVDPRIDATITHPSDSPQTATAAGTVDHERVPVIKAAPNPAERSGDRLGGSGLRIHGEAVDGSGGAIPACRLRCEIRNALDHVVHAEDVTTDDIGRFVCTSPQQASVVSVSVVCEAVGYWSRPVKEFVRPRATETTFLRLVCHVLDAKISGTVVDTVGRPIAGAKVGAAARDAVTSSDAAGSFSLAVAAGTRVISLYAVAEGYAVAHREVPIARSEHKENVLLTLAAGWTLTGRVVDEGGAAVAGAAVFTPHTQHASRLLTAADGTFSLGGLALSGARHLLMVRHADFVAQDVYIVESGPRHLEITLAKGTEVAGTVVCADLPVPAAKVVITPAAGGQPATSFTKEDGSFVVRGVRPGQHELQVTGRGFAKHVSLIEVVTQAAVANVVLTPERAITGRVVDQQGRPVASILIRAVVQSTGASIDATDLSRNTTDHSGRFHLGSLPDQIVTLQLIRKGALLHRQDVQAGLDDCVIVVGAYSVLDGLVVDTLSSRAVTSFSLRFTPFRKDSIVWPAEPQEYRDAAGYWLVDHHIDEGAFYLVEITSPGYSRRLEVVQGRKGAIAELRETARVFRLTSTTTMSGTIKGSDGTAAAGAVLMSFNTGSIGELSRVHMNATDAVANDVGSYLLSKAPVEDAFVSVKHGPAHTCLGPFRNDPDRVNRRDLVVRN